MKSRFQSRLEEMQAIKKSLADGVNLESNKIKKEDIFDFDLEDLFLKEIEKVSLLELMKLRNYTMRLKHQIEYNINHVYNKDEIEHLDKSIDYLNKEINKIIDS